MGTDIYIICDRQTNKSKGLAYVELGAIGSMGRILSLSGTELYGQSIQIKPSEMEKNVQWTLQKQVQQGMMTAATSPSTNPTHLPAPGIDVAAAATAAAAKLLCTTGTKPLLNPFTNTQEDQRQRKIYIGNLPREINELVLRNMFEPFGVVESSNVIKDSTGKSQGYGFILFREKEIVEKAIHAMNGMLIGSNIIKVNYVSSSGFSLPTHSYTNNVGQLQMHGNPLCPITPNVDLDRVDDDGSLKINSQFQSLNVNKLYIRRILVNKAMRSLRRSYRYSFGGRFPRAGNPCHIEIILEEWEEPTHFIANDILTNQEKKRITYKKLAPKVRDKNKINGLKSSLHTN